MVLQAPPEGPLQRIVGERLSLSETAQAYRLISSVFSDSAVAGAEDAAVVTVEGTAGILAALTIGIVAAIVIGIVVLILVFILLLHKSVRDQFARIWLVGDAIARVFDAVLQTTEGILTWVDNEFLSLWHGLVLDFHKFMSMLIALFGLPSLSALQGQVNKATATLARLPYDVDALGNRLMKALSESLASIWTNISELWHWVHVALADINLIWNALNQVWSWIHHLLYVTAVLTELVHWLQGEIHKVWHNITDLWRHMSSAEIRISTLEHEIVALQHRVLTLEADVAPALETVAVLALLMPLLTAGEQGIESLVKTRDDPCRCLFTPGSKGWMLTMMVMYLWYRDGP